MARMNAQSQNDTAPQANWRSKEGGVIGCLVPIIVIMAILASFGVIQWESVGGVARLLAYIVGGIFLLMVIGAIFSKFSE